MIAVSNEFKQIQDSSQIRPVRRIELSRRLADGSGWEASTIDITNEVVNLDRLSWKLDTDNLNEFKASNIRVEFDNSNRQWDEGSSARFSGFLRFHSRFKIFLGLDVNGTEETFPVFTGVLEDVIEVSDKPTVQLTIESFDAILRTTSAEPAGIVVTDELLGIGDGVQSEFFTSLNAAGVFKEIRVSGQPLRAGLNISLSDLNDPTKPGKVTFISAQPGPGEEVRADYISWKIDQPIEQVVTDLMALTPLVPIDQIDSVEFNPPVEREILHTLESDFQQYDLRQAAVIPEPSPPSGDGLITNEGIDSKSEWETGVTNDLNLTRIPNGISAQWTAHYEGDFPPPQEKLEIDGIATFPWNEQFNQSSSSVAGGVMTVSLPNAGLSTYVLTNSNEDPGLGRSISIRIKVNNLTGSIHIGSIQSGSNLGARMSVINTGQVQIETGGNTFGPFNVSLTSFRTLRLVMNTSANTWEFYVDGGLVSNGSLGTGPFAPIIGGVFVDVLTTANTNFEIDFLRFNSREAGFPTGTWEKEIDYGISLLGLTTFALITNMGPFFADVQGAGSNARYFFTWREDAGVFVPEVEVTNGATLGTFTNVDQPQHIRFRIQVQGDEDPTITGVKALYLPALVRSNLIDGGTGVVTFDTWKGTFENNDGSVQRFTATPNGAGGFTSYAALGPGDTILTDDIGTNVQEIVMVALISTAGLNLPILRESLVTFTTKTVLVSVAVLTGKTVLDVVNELAAHADFEIGLKGDGSFFFRNKDTSPVPDLVLDDLNSEAVNNFSPGWERIFNRIRATHGNFIKEVDPVSEGEPSPTSTDKYGDRFLSVGGGNLILQKDVDLASSIATRYFQRYKDPQRRLTIITRFFPEMELGDRVSVTINIPRQIAQSFDTRILGLAHDMMQFRTEFELQEI